MDNHQAAFLLSLALAITDAIKGEEPGTTAESVKRRKRLRLIEGEIKKATDSYLPPGGFSPEDLDKASTLFDEIDARIKELYPAVNA